MSELELIERERRMIERRIRAARFGAVKSLDSFDFKAMASLNKPLVMELARCQYIEARENVIVLGPSSSPALFCCQILQSIPKNLETAKPSING